jgi:hypothetical protein
MGRFFFEFYQCLFSISGQDDFVTFFGKLLLVKLE